MKTIPQIRPEEAAVLVKSGDTLLVGGFGVNGNPLGLLAALAQSTVGDLTYVSNNVGEVGVGGGLLLRNGQIKRVVGSFFTSNPEAVDAVRDGTVEAHLIPQGTLAEAIRAGGAGIGGFFTPTGANTKIAEDAETRELNGKVHVFVPGLRGNVAFVRARKADESGNLVYQLTEQNFNKAMATAADVVIAEIDEIVPIGALNPNEIHTPGCYVDYLVRAPRMDTATSTDDKAKPNKNAVSEGRWAIARRALKELERGSVVNLGVGIPTLIADLIAPAHGILLHSENGMIGVGPAPTDGDKRTFPVNAGKQAVTALPGASYFDSSDSFSMIRGGHIDVAVMGGLQVDTRGNLANWAVPGKPLLGVGGAMDLAAGAKKLIITMTHTNADGSPKIVDRCDLPLTAHHVVDMVITDLAVFTFVNNELTLVELMPGTDVQQVRDQTSTNFAENL